MNTVEQSEFSSRAGIRVVLATALLVSVLGFLSGRSDEAQGEGDGVPTLQTPLSSVLPACAMERVAAAVRARELEALAEGSWERAPYAASDAARAVWTIAQSGACYAVGGDREGRQRVDRKRSQYGAELLARWRRTSLLLEIARRGERSEEVRKHVATLLALSEHSGEEGAAYRRWLRSVDGEAASALAERAREKEH